MGLLGTMTVNFNANIAGLTAGTNLAKTSLAGVSNEVKSTAGSIRDFAMGAAVVGTAALVGIGVASVKAAGDFQQGLTLLTTSAGELPKNLSMVGDGIKSIAVETGTSTKDLLSAMFMINSSGKIGAEGLTVLRAAAQGAKTDNADLTTVTKALTTIMTDYHLPASSAAAATNELIAAAKAGKMHMQDLAGSLGAVLPIAQIAHVSFADVGGAIAMMTNAGKDAQVSAQNLNFMLRSFEAPSGIAQKSMKAIGLSAQDLSNTLSTKGLPAALQLVEDHIANKFPAGSIEATTALKNIAGGAAGLSVAMIIGGQNMNAYKANVTSINAALHAGGSSVEEWSAVQANFNTKVSQAKEVLEVMSINIGTKLLPVVGKLFDAFSSPAFQSFANQMAGVVTVALLGLINGISTVVSVGANLVAFFQHNQAAMIVLVPVLLAVAGALAGALAYSFYLSAAAAWTAAAGFIAAAAIPILIGIAIGLAVAGIILAVQHWGQITAWLQGVWGAFSGWFMGILGATGAFFVGLWTGIANFFVGVWNGIISFLQAAWVFIVNVVKVGALLALAVLFAPIVIMAGLFIWLYNHNYYFKALVDSIVNFFKGCFTWAVGAWQGFVGWLGGLWNSAVGLASAAWARVTSAISAAVTFVVGWLRGIWQGAISNLGALWGTLSGLASRAWDAVAGVFQGVWGRISAPLASLWSQFSGWFGNLAGQALSWGANVISSFISGIESKIAGIGTSLAKGAAQVAAFLGFHSPTEKGPGRDADKWAPNFVNMYAAGLLAGIPLIQNAMSKLVDPTQSSSHSIAYPGSSSPAVLAGVAAASAASSSSQSQEIHIYIDGKEVTSRLGPHIANAIRASGVRSR